MSLATSRSSNLPLLGSTTHARFLSSQGPQTRLLLLCTCSSVLITCCLIGELLTIRAARVGDVSRTPSLLTRRHNPSLHSTFSFACLRTDSEVCVIPCKGPEVRQSNAPLSHMRAALTFQLRNNLRGTGTEPRWLALDYDLADACTKQKAEAHLGLLHFLQHGKWSVKSCA